jgi:hypothetical protein
MLKNILKLDGAQQLSKNEQKQVNGGITKRCSDFLNTCSNVVKSTRSACNTSGGVFCDTYCCYL